MSVGDQALAVLRDVDESDLETLDFLVNQIPDELFYEIGQAGGPPIVHRLSAPILASLEPDGLIEWTGEYRRGRKVWRATAAGRATAVGSDKPEKSRARRVHPSPCVLRKQLS